MIVEISDTRRPKSLSKNLYVTNGGPLDDASKIRKETWVEKDYFDSIELSDGTELCGTSEFMFRMYTKDSDWGMLWSGARAIVKETVDFNGTDFYCIVFELDHMIHNNVPREKFMNLYNSGMKVVDIINTMHLNLTGSGGGHIPVKLNL